MSAIDSLFKPFSLKSLETQNRVVMAPMTRNHSPDNAPSDASVEYYRRRAAGGVGLIITEGTCPNHIAANGYPDVPYFHGEERLAGWKKWSMLFTLRVKSRHSCGTVAACASAV